MFLNPKRVYNFQKLFLNPKQKSEPPKFDTLLLKQQDTKAVTPRWNKGPGVEVEGSVETRAEVQVTWRPFNVVPRTKSSPVQSSITTYRQSLFWYTTY